MARTRRSLVAPAAALALLGAACLGGGGAATDEEGGGTVSVLANFSGDEATRFEETIATFEEQSEVDVEFTGADDFAQLIVTRVESGDPPDIAIFPQPGLLLDIQERDALRPIDDVVDVAALEETLIPGFLESVRIDGEGPAYAVPMRMAIKSLVWYPVPEFEEAGYAIPETSEDLAALEEQITADGGTPWCIGIESGDATGWVVTDWMEEYMLRTVGPEGYDQWVNHEIPFDAPEVQRAGELFGEIAFTEGEVLGGPEGIINTPFGDSADPMFDEEPGCWMHRQGNFISGLFPEEVQADLDANVGAFYFPPVTDGFDGRPVLAGGDLAAILSENPGAEEFLTYLATPEYGATWAAAGGWLSPHSTFDASQYPNDVTRQIATIANEADILRYDGSDLMPGAVGAGTFWSESVDWLGGQTDLPGMLADIEESWPADEEESS